MLSLYDNSMRKVARHGNPSYGSQPKKRTYQKLSRSSFANIMSSRAAGATLEIVRVLCACIWETTSYFLLQMRGLHTPTSTPRRAT